MCWPVSFEQVRNVQAGLLWGVWACLGGIVLQQCSRKKIESMANGACGIRRLPVWCQELRNSPKWEPKERRESDEDKREFAEQLKRD